MIEKQNTIWFVHISSSLSCKINNVKSGVAGNPDFFVYRFISNIKRRSEINDKKQVSDEFRVLATF